MFEVDHTTPNMKEQLTKVDRSYNKLSLLLLAEKPLHFDPTYISVFHTQQNKLTQHQVCGLHADCVCTGG